MTSQLTLFNKNVQDAIDYLIKLVEKDNKRNEEVKQLKLAREKIGLAKSYDPQKILLNFFKFVYPFKSDIMNKNEKFFLEEDIKKYIQKEKMKEYGIDNIDEKYLITKSIDIKNYWNTMTDAQKNQIWQYFQNMTICCERYVIQNTK